MSRVQIGRAENVINEMAHTCVLLFGKSPTEGQVKTRLAKEIGSKHAVELYKHFVEDLVSLLKSFNIHFKFYFYPAGAKQDFVGWLGMQYCYTPQAGANLGERIKNAFYHTFEENFTRVVAVGSDSPDLPKDFLRQAFSALDTHDAVIGPAGDGGYYLIGFTKKTFLPEAFEGICWSSNRVFEQTVNILKKHGRKVYLLPQWYDVDTLADLKSMLSRNKNMAFNKSKTYSYLMSNKLRSGPNV